MEDQRLEVATSAAYAASSATAGFASLLRNKFSETPTKTYDRSSVS